MSIHRLVLLSCLLLLSSGLRPGPTSSEITYGPYNGSFIASGLGLKKALPVEDVPVQAAQPWSIYCWVRSDGPLDGRVLLLAGFGEPDAVDGAARYFAAREGQLFFWSGKTEVMTNARIAPGKWQMLAATFDGDSLILYLNGARVAAGKPELSPSAPVIYLAPTASPWPQEASHFAGRIAGFTLLGRALAAGEIRALMVQEKRLDAMPFEAASKTWPVQTRGQSGLRAPQEQATVPAAPDEPHSPPPESQSLAAGMQGQTQGHGPRRAEGGPTLTLYARSGSEWALAGPWQLIEASAARGDGASISLPGFDTKGWLDAVVPGTVLTTLVARGLYPDPDYGLNNLFIPETLNKRDYWYRTEFTPPASLRGRRFSLTFHGINYSALVWLNGKPLGEIRGAFARGEFDVGPFLMPGRLNALAVRVQPPPHPGIPHEQSIVAGPGPNGGAMCLDGPTFICTEGWDWIPGVRDRETGIWQDVSLRATGPVEIGDVHVVTELPLPDTGRASVTLTVPLRNGSAQSSAGILEAAFEGVTVRRRVSVRPGQTEVRLSPSDFPQLNIKGPRLWWPNGYGNPELYHLKVSFQSDGGSESDSRSLRFGIRELSYELTLMDATGRLRRVEFVPTASGGTRVVDVRHEGLIESVEGWVASVAEGAEESAALRPLNDRRASPYLVIRVNGVRIAVRGGNWGLDDSRKRVTRERLEPFFRLHREANLNMVRNWCGQSTEEIFYDLADEYGLLVWNDFWLSTQDFNLEPTDPALFLANAREVIRRFRNHPSIAIWCGRNEGVPPPLINEGLDELVRALDGTRYYIPNSRKINLQDSGPWHYGDPETFFTRRGPGFSTEIGLPSPPAIETMRMMLPRAAEWPPNDSWSYHDWHSRGGAEVVPFMTAMEEELGPPVSLEDFERKAQLLNYNSHRAMFEGFNAHLWSPNTGRLMWMTHPAWPSMVWQMYSSDYGTYGAFYGIRKACEPVHVQLNLPGMTTAVINNTMRPLRNLRLSARIFSIRGEELFNREESLSAAAGALAEGFRLGLPAPASGEGVVLIKLLLRDERGETLSENFYWYAEQKAGYRKLNEMAAADVDCSARWQNGAAGPPRVILDLANRSAIPALATEVTLRDAKTNARLLPAYATDNFVSLLPGERRRIAVELPAAASMRGVRATLSGWNVRAVAVTVR